MAAPGRMMHPRWRWIMAAGKLGKREPTDGLGTAFAPDLMTKQLIKAAEGKSKVKAQNKALDLFQSQSTRAITDAMLLATCSVLDVATILGEKEEVVQWYADWFFDITVFETQTSKVLYLDKISQRDPQEADLLRRAVSLNKESLAYLYNGTAETWNAQKALVKGLEVTANLAFSFVPREIEAGLQVENPEKYEQHLKYFQIFYGMMLKTVDIMTKNEMDKTKEEFLTNFVMKLKDVDPAEMIKVTPPAELV